MKRLRVAAWAFVTLVSSPHAVIARSPRIGTMLRRWLVLGLGLTFGATLGSAALRVDHLSCEWVRSPVGVDAIAPRLSWKLASPERGAQQTAWQVQVASSRDLLIQSRPDRWDSGRIPTANQLAVPYGGRPLATAEQVYWRVRSWDEHDQPSPWSEVATWTMGQMDPTGWSAKWITDPGLLSLTRDKLGFSTPPSTDENTAQWLTVDLGRPYPIDSIVLHALVHTVSERLGFPRWYKLEVSLDADFTNATVVADQTKEPLNVWLTRVAVPTKGVSARFVRLTATRLRMMAEEDQPQWVGRLALRQIEVISAGQNVALNARVTASASIENGVWSAAAVVDGKELPGANPRASETLLVRREFSVRPNLRRAVLFVTGLGSYTAALNGVGLGDEDLFKPAWTDPSHRCLYDTREVTGLLRPGANALGLTLAGGMYNVPAIPGRYTKFVSAPRPLLAFAQLRLEYADGTIETVATDSRWRAAPGATTFAHVYAGEDHDARREPKDWTLPGFDDAAWIPAVETVAPQGSLHGLSESSPPIRVQATLPVLSRRVINPSVTVYDLGQNAALMPRITVHGAAGTMVKIKPAELLSADGTIDPASTRPAKSDASWNYTLAGAADGETWVPRFFYHGARYLQVECSAPEGAELPVVDRLDGLVVHSDSAPVGEFACSNELFNRIDGLIRWAQRSNLVHVLTDCPHRERLGWLEQYHLNGPSLRSHYDLTRLYEKAFRDMVDAQRPNGLVPSITPEYVRFDEGFRDSPEWGSALILAAWQQFVWTGDITALREHYPAMQRYFEYLGTRSQDGIVSHGLGDWYDLGPNPPGLAQLTPIALTATATYFEDARTLAAIATRLGRSADANRYAATADAIAAAFNQQFLDRAKGTYATGSQTANAMPLVLGLVPEALRPHVAEQLVGDIVSRANSITAGDVGFRYLLNALSGMNRNDVVFAINDQTEKPGYGYQLARGATSLAEAWDAGRRSSQNHFMLGHLVEWLYADLAGFAPDPDAPGFARALVRPHPVGDVTWSRCRYESVRGPFVVEWHRTADRFTLEVTVPANSRALVELPTRLAGTVTESGVPVSGAPGVKVLPVRDGAPAFEIESGRYQFDCAF